MDLFGSILGAGLGLLGSGGNDKQTVQQSFAPEFQPLAGAVAQRGMDIGNMPYQPYPYSTVAGFNPFQFAGFDMTANQAMGSQLPQQAEQNLSNTLQGNFGAPQGQNPYLNAQSTPGSNPYAGSNPFLQQNIDSTLGDITRSFNNTVAPSMAATALKGGSFGNSGMLESENESRRQLAGELGRVSSGMRMQDYGMQQGLAESDINRRLGAQQQDFSRSAGLHEAQLGRDSSNWNAERGRMMQGLGLSPSIFGLGFQPGQQLQGIGAQMQQQGQNVLDSNFAQFQDAQNFPFKTFDAMMAPFGRASGGTTTSTGPSGNPVAGMLGGAMLGNQMQQQFPNMLGLFGGGAPSFGGLGGGAGNFNFGGGF